MKMLGEANLFGEYGPRAKPGDAIYTPDWCAADMVNFFKPTGRILEPCRGGGAFMRALPPNAFWCEITEGRDFFAWRDPIDWIITNPPYTIEREFFEHSMTVADNIVFLLPARNVFSSYGFVKAPIGWGGMVSIRWYGGGAGLNFPMGNPIAAIHWAKDHQHLIRESFYDGNK